MNKLLFALFLIISITQTACNSSSLNTVSINDKFINIDGYYDENDDNNLKSGYSKTALMPKENESQITFNLTEIKEFQVNQFGTGNGHSTPVVAMNNNSNFVVTWKQQSDIFAQRYDSNGVPQGKEFRVNNPEHIIYNGKKSPAYINTMDSPKVAIDNKGNFIVVWERLERDFNSLKGVLVNSDIFARSFDINGNPLNNEFKVNSSDDKLQKTPAIARNSNGDFIISWSTYKTDSSSVGISARKFSASAIAGNEFLVTNNLNEKSEPSVAINNEGKFVISWYDVSDNNIYGKLFESNSSPIGNVFKVNNSGDGEHGLPKVAMDKTGNFVITWQKTSDDGSVFGVLARRYNSIGSPFTSEFRVNSNTNNPYIQYDPAIAMNSNGNFVITWQNLNKNFKGEAGIFAQKFNNTGNKLGSEFLVKTYSGMEETEPSAAMDSDNNFVIAWTDEGIHAKLFDNNFTD